MTITVLPVYLHCYIWTISSMFDQYSTLLLNVWLMATLMTSSRYLEELYGSRLQRL